MPPTATTPLNYGLGKNTGPILQYLSSLFGPAVNQRGLQPLTPAQLTKQAGQYVTRSLQPQIGAATRQSNAELGGGVGQIRGGTVNYERSVAPIAGQVGSIGREQAAQDTAETQALSQYLQGAGGQTFGDVNSKIAGTGTDAGPAANLGTGAAGITAAVGLAGAHDANRQGATNESFAALLPGFAALQGQQAEQGFRSTQQANLNKQVGDLQAQAPGLEQQIAQQLTQNEITKAGDRSSAAQAAAQAISSFLGGQADRRTSVKLAGMNNAADLTKTKIGADVTLKTDKADNATTVATNTADNTTQTNIAAADRQTQERIAHLNATAGQPLTAPERVQYGSLAHQLVAGAFTGGTTQSKVPERPTSDKPEPGHSVLNPDGKTYTNYHPQLNYKQAIELLRSQGLLSDPRTAKIAMDNLNLVYHPGERGRPTSPAQKKAGAPAGEAVGAAAAAAARLLPRGAGRATAGTAGAPTSNVLPPTYTGRLLPPTYTGPHL